LYRTPDQEKDHRTGRQLPGDSVSERNKKTPISKSPLRKRRGKVSLWGEKERKRERVHAFWLKKIFSYELVSQFDREARWGESAMEKQWMLNAKEILISEKREGPWGQEKHQALGTKEEESVPGGVL